MTKNKIFFTADLHLDHRNIIQYCNRPFTSCIDMNDTLINNWNKKVSKNDVVYHLGDFCFNKNYKAFEEFLNGTIIHIKGNHDKKIKEAKSFDIIELNDKKIYLRHIPLEYNEEFPLVDLILCGHIHQLWKVKKYVSKNTIPIINVGCDVWDYKPVSLEEILELEELKI